MKGWDDCSHLILAQLSPPEVIYAWTDMGGSAVWRKGWAWLEGMVAKNQLSGRVRLCGAYRMVCSFGNLCGLVLLTPHLRRMLGWKREVQGGTISLSTVNTVTTALLIGWEGPRISLCFFSLEFIFIYLLTQGSWSHRERAVVGSRLHKCPLLVFGPS